MGWTRLLICAKRSARVGDGDAFSLHHVAAVRQDRQQQVGDAVVEEVDLVHVQHPAMRLRKQPRLENCAALLLCMRQGSDEGRATFV